MKNLVITCLIILSTFCLTAQPILYALTSQGGSNNGGTLVSFNVASNELSVMHHFDSATGSWPSGSLFQASNGLFYGMTTRGGINNRGVIFSFNPATLVYNKLF